MLNKEIKGKLYQYLINKLGLRYYRRGWLKGTCPSCGRPDKFGVNLSFNRTNCFVCGYNPAPFNLVMEQENLPDIQAVKKFLNLFEGKEYLEPVVEKIERVEVKLPESYNNIIFGDSKVADQARRYIISRGFDITEVSLLGWGYCTRGEYAGYIILPFYMGGKLIYFNARKFIGPGVKYKNPSIDDFGIGKSLILYNSDALALYKEIYLVEGVLNAHTIGDQAIASGGKKVSNYQISMLLQSDVKKVNLLLDPDALDECIKIALKICFHKMVKVVTWPGNQDVNDLGKEETLKRVNDTPWMDYNYLLKWKNEQGAQYSYFKGGLD